MSRRPRVLIVDDQAAQVRALDRLLRDYDLDVDTASTGEEALLMVAREETYQCIITDLRLPGLSGQELARRLRQPRLIVLSGDPSALPRLHHVDVRMAKPCDLDRLVAAILGERVGHA